MQPQTETPTRPWLAPGTHREPGSFTWVQTWPCLECGPPPAQGPRIKHSMSTKRFINQRMKSQVDQAWEVLRVAMHTHNPKSARTALMAQRAASASTTTLMKHLWKLPNTKTVNMWPWKWAELKLSSENDLLNQCVCRYLHIYEFQEKNTQWQLKTENRFTMFKCWLQLYTGRSTVTCLLPLD